MTPSRAIILLACALSGGCATRSPADYAIRGLRPIGALPPVTARDTVVRLALEIAVTQGIPDYSPRPHTIVMARQGISAHILPTSATTAFYILDSTRLQDTADRHGLFPVLAIAARLEGDSATVQIGSHFILPQGRTIVLMAGGGCAWRYRRTAGNWVLTRDFGCFIS